MSVICRRAALSGLGAMAGLIVSGNAKAIGEGSKLQIAQLKYSGAWDTRPRATLVLAQELRYRTSIDTNLKRVAIDLNSPLLFEVPFLILVGEGRCRFTSKERSRLKAWIEAGGMLVIDNAGRGQPSAAFDASIRSELAAIFPGRKLTKIPPKHVLYRSFYVLDFPAGRAIHRTYLEGVSVDDRLAVIYTQNDLMGALDRDRLGGWTYDVVPGGERQREKAKRLAINIVQYAMCLDYKNDQVHMDYLLHRRRWRNKSPVIE